MKFKSALISILSIYFLCFITDVNSESLSSSGCGCCPYPRCSLQPNPCSSNSDCECLLMTMTGAGMCATTAISCSTLTRCENDNQTCSIPNTICVNNTRCNIPVCYPIAHATQQVCPTFGLRSPTTMTLTTVPTTTEEIITTTTTTSIRIITTTTRTTTTAPTTRETTTPPTTRETTTPPTTRETTTPSTTRTTTTASTTRTTTTTSTTMRQTTTTTIIPNACSNGIRCLNNGTCQPTETGYYCICRGSFYGSNCQLNGSTTDFSLLDRIINGSNVTYDRTVENVLNRHNWTNIVAVIDVTGSMSPCAAAIYKWINLAFDRANKIQYYVFFNDGDDKPTANKTIGSTGGIYGVDDSDLSTVLNVMKTAMKNGNGGDGPENDLEAILYGIRKCPNCSNIIHIADNQVTPRDMILLRNVTKPVKVLVCQLGTSALNTNLMNIAATTGGSIHTVEQDIINLSGIPIGGTITIGSYTYQRTVNGYIRI